MRYPNFLLIGAAKSGTTSISSYLSQHPDVYISPQKEPHFFALEGRKTQFEGPLDHERINRMGVRDRLRYEALFAQVDSEKAVGEASTSYLPSTRARENIRKYVPNARILAILRQPAERAFSEYLFQRRDGAEPCATFTEALQHEKSGARTNWWCARYLEFGFYYAQLRPYFEEFRKDRIRVLLYDDLLTDTRSALKDIFEFLEVDASFQPNTSHRHNMSGIPKSRILHAIHGFIMRPNQFKTRFLKPLFPAKVRLIMRNRLLGTIQKVNLERVSLDSKTHQMLTDVYREDILALQGLINRDLSTWLR